MKKILVTSLIVISILSAENNITIIKQATKIVDDIGDKTKAMAIKVKDKSSGIIESIKDTTKNFLDSNSSLQEIDGATLYSKCKGCHGSDGKIKALNKSPIIASQNIDKLIVKLKAYKNGERNKYGMGRLMTTQTESLSISEIKALSEYISKL
ncbi:Cytochrome C553 (soluble cytochrome f) [hydrothermal vent metagenome]|uniref:Cytochrome C553 (Soluble cytochrome f) n=1 Tax=hydrothermal vent metagenome TaxID=652676 RepID=A0A1W1EL75_9ZZZZ